MSTVAWSARALLRRRSWRPAVSSALPGNFIPPACAQLRFAARSSAPVVLLSATGNAGQCRFYASKAKGKQKDRGKEGKAKAKGPNGDEHNVEDADGRGKRAKGGIDTARLVSGSQRVLGGEDQAEYERTEERMGVTIDWFRREVAGMEARGAGRVTPDVLKPVRVTLPGASNAAPVSLQEIATVGVRDGTTLVVTAFEDSNLRHIERAIYAAQIPHVVPQKVDNRTLKIPLPKPTVDARVELVKSAAKIAEDTRVQLRRHEQAGVKKMKYDKHSVESEQFHDLLQRHIKDVDKIVADMKKNLNVK